MIKLLHPGDRTIRVVKPYHLEGRAFAGYLRAPWDCVCVAKCNCDQRPTVPEPDQIDEAKATHAKLAEGIKAAEKAAKKKGGE